MDKLAATGIIYRIFSSRLFISVSICLKCHEVVATKSFHLVNILTGQLDSQRIFVLCEARILWYSADRTSSRALRDTTRKASHKKIPQTEAIFAHVNRINGLDHRIGHFASMRPQRIERISPKRG